MGANRIAIASATERIDSVPAGKQRFQSGSIDEVSFLGNFLHILQNKLLCRLLASQSGDKCSSQTRDLMQATEKDVQTFGFESLRARTMPSIML